MRTMILLVIFIYNCTFTIYGCESNDSIISLSKDLLSIHYNNPSEKDSDSIINREMYKAFDSFLRKKEIDSDNQKSLLLDMVYTNSYSLYTDGQECDRYNKRVICCWISLALLVNDDRKWTFIAYAKQHLAKMRDPVNEKLGIMLVEQLLTEIEVQK